MRTICRSVRGLGHLQTVPAAGATVRDVVNDEVGVIDQLQRESLRPGLLPRLAADLAAQRSWRRGREAPICSIGSASVGIGPMNHNYWVLAIQLPHRWPCAGVHRGEYLTKLE